MLNLYPCTAASTRDCTGDAQFHDLNARSRCRNTYLPAQLQRIRVWRNNRVGLSLGVKGEGARGPVAKLQISDADVVENAPLGIDLPPRLFGPWGSNVIDRTIFVGSGGWDGETVSRGLSAADYPRMLVRNATFVKFAGAGNLGAGGSGGCGKQLPRAGVSGEGGWEMRFSGTTWVRSGSRVAFSGLKTPCGCSCAAAEESGMILVDLDGSFSGRVGHSVVPKNSLLESKGIFPDCIEDGAYGVSAEGAAKGMICPLAFARVVVAKVGELPYGSAKSLIVRHGTEHSHRGASPRGVFVEESDAEYMLHKWRPRGLDHLLSMNLANEKLRWEWALRHFRDTCTSHGSVAR